MTIEGCKEYCKDFTVALTIFDVYNKTQMYDSVITWKENASKDWNCIISIFLSSCIIYFVFGYACRGRTKGGKGEQFPGGLITTGAPKRPNKSRVLSSIQ